MEKKEIEKVLASYFGQVDYEADIRHSGLIALVDIKYTDFRPMVTVRRELEDLIPMSLINITERRYSDEVLKDELMKLYDHDVDVMDGDRRLGIIILLEEKLFAKEIK